MDRYDLTQAEFPTTPFPFLEHCVLMGKRGSEAHGTFVPSATVDRDLMAVIVPPLDYYFGLKQWEGKSAIHGEWDTVAYSLPRFLTLLKVQNPNILTLLWLRDKDYVHMTPVGRKIVEHRGVFRARTAAYKAFVGVATSHMQRFKDPTLQVGRLGAKRKARVAEHGYDTKDAAHVIRLLAMVIEYLDTGTLAVYRTHDRDLLLAIKNGQVPLPDVEARANVLLAEARLAWACSTMPPDVDEEAVHALCYELTQEFFAG